MKWARICKPDDEVVIATKDGFATRFLSTDITPTSRTARGVRALSLRPGDCMADMDILKSSSSSSSSSSSNMLMKNKDDSSDKLIYSATHVLAVTEKGSGKRVPIAEFTTHKRGGKGSIIIKFKSKVGGGGMQLRKATTATGNILNNKKGISIKTGTSGGSDNINSGDALSCMRLCAAGDEVVLSTKKGAIIRQSVDNLSIQSRTATGMNMNTSAVYEDN